MSKFEDLRLDIKRIPNWIWIRIQVRIYNDPAGIRIQIFILFHQFWYVADRDNSESSGEEGEAGDAGLAPQRVHYLIRSHRRRDRLVKTIDAALDLDNYTPLPETTEEMKYELTMPGTVHNWYSVFWIRITADPKLFGWI